MYRQPVGLQIETLNTQAKEDRDAAAQQIADLKVSTKLLRDLAWILGLTSLVDVPGSTEAKDA